MHSPHHLDSGQRHYLITAACFEHAPHIGHSVGRMNAFAEEWLAVLDGHTIRVLAWVVLPNHYHALVATSEVLALLETLGKLHGRTSFRWNGEEQTRGRQVWCKAVETVMKSADHHHATLNYVHQQPCEARLCRQVDRLALVQRRGASRCRRQRRGGAGVEDVSHRPLRHRLG